jgi:hypothetical protein
MMKNYLAILAILACSSNAFAQTNAGNPFGNTGLQPLSAFGFSDGTTGAGTTGATGGTTGAGGITLGGGGFGQFDSTFGASIISGLGAAQAIGRTNAGLGLSGLGGLGGLGGAFGVGGMGGRGGFNNQNNNQNNQPAVRAVVRVGFPVMAPSAAATGQKVTDRLSRLPLPNRVSQYLEVAMEGRTAILRGQVASAEDGELAVRILSLEPGIDDVRNELIVSDVPPTDPSASDIEVVPAPTFDR